MPELTGEIRAIRKSKQVRLVGMEEDRCRWNKEVTSVVSQQLYCDSGQSGGDAVYVHGFCSGRNHFARNYELVMLIVFSAHFKIYAHAVFAAYLLGQTTVFSSSIRS